MSHEGTEPARVMSESMLAVIEFRGAYHVSTHIAADSGGPLCGGRRQEGNYLYGPHRVGVPPTYTGVCPSCQEVYHAE